MTELRIVDEILEAFYNEILRHGYTNGVKLIPYFGGDYYVADLILSRLRPIMGDIYVEVFGGSCYIAQRINVMRRLDTQMLEKMRKVAEEQAAQVVL